MVILLKHCFIVALTQIRARLVVCGYSQRKGIDYNETYDLLSVKMLMFYNAVYKWMKAVFDVKSAFFEGEADDIQYAKLPAMNNIPESPYQRKLVWH
jgi:hypothetical protein